MKQGEIPIKIRDAYTVVLSLLLGRGIERRK